MEIKVLNWNIGGAKFIEQKSRADRDRVKTDLNAALAKLIGRYEPDVVTLQEVVQYKEPCDPEPIGLIDNISGYRYYSFPLIDSLLFSSQAKWNLVKHMSDWDSSTYFAQGNAMMFRDDAPLFPVWDLSNLNETSPGRQRLAFLKQFRRTEHKRTGDLDLAAAKQRAGEDKKYLIEHVHLESGLYFGDRNTEPRAALVAHLILNPGLDCPRQICKPLDVFIVNVHLVTITKERVGIPKVDSEAARLRLAQLRTIFNGIVSRYNTWADDGYPQRGVKRDAQTWETFNRHKPVWILCGDFNFTEESDEYDFIKRRNFIDTTPKKGRRSPYGRGTKSSGAGNPPTLTLDYVFAGPKFIAFDRVFEQEGINQNIVDHDVRASDHYPVLSRLPLLLSSVC